MNNEKWIILVNFRSDENLFYYIREQQGTPLQIIVRAVGEGLAPPAFIKSTQHNNQAHNVRTNSVWVGDITRPEYIFNE